MSIYASWRVLDGEHEDECAFWVEEGECCFEPGDPDDCTCGLPRAPLVYRASHVLPSDGDPKGGGIEVASIPDHITRDGRDDAPEGTPKPWLRFSAYGAQGDATLVLTRQHVEILRDVLTAWLATQQDGGEQ